MKLVDDSALERGIYLSYSISWTHLAMSRAVLASNGREAC